MKILGKVDQTEILINTSIRFVRTICRNLGNNLYILTSLFEFVSINTIDVFLEIDSCSRSKPMETFTFQTENSYKAYQAIMAARAGASNPGHYKAQPV